MTKNKSQHKVHDNLSEEEIQAVYRHLDKENALLHFNGINGATGQYGLPPMPGGDFAGAIKGEPPPENKGELDYKRNEGNVDAPVKPPNDPALLDQAGWTVIFAHDADPAIQAALKELLDLRREQAGERFQILSGKYGLRSKEPKSKFFARHEIGPGLADPEQMGYYVLLVGSPEAIPYSFQYQLDVMRAVGRIHFETPDEAAQYAHNVVMAETGQVRLPRRAAFFGVANTDDPATQLSTQYLVEPLYKSLRSSQPFVRTLHRDGKTKTIEMDWDLKNFMGKKATKAQLGKLLDGSETPAFLFTASHGIEFPLNDPRQLSQQGALLCQDWPGPQEHRGEVPQDFYFAGDDLHSDANLLGLISFHFACYGAGTPQLDQFAKQAFKDERAQIAPHNFVAQLPTRLLNQGALAVAGHVERAWGYSFLAPGRRGTIGQTGAFETTLAALFRGDPIGLATESFNMRYAEMASDLSHSLEELEYDPEFITAHELAALWTANNDARGYVVLGDPAVRLPVAEPGIKSKDRPALIRVTAPEPSPQAAVERIPSAEPAASEPAAAVMGMDADFAFAVRQERASLTESLKKFTGQLTTALSKAADDISSLEVKTYTSSDLETLDHERNALTGQVELRAYTRVSFDGDIQVCVPERGSAIDNALWQVHRDMVQEAQENRTKFLAAIAEMAVQLVNLLKP